MQGVRTTRGCISCRRRKKGCDLQTPSCGRCQQLNVICKYEKQRWTFVPQPSEYQAAASPLVPSAASQISLSNTNAELQAAAEFWNLYLPKEDGALDGSIGGVLSAPWIPTVRALAEECNDVRLALQACTYAGLGWMREDSALVQHATGLYGQALRETNLALQDPVLVQSDNVLACCRLLSLFEMFRRGPNDPAKGRAQVNDWRSHVEGTCRIVELRGREKHLSGHGIHLYDGVRMTAMTSGLGGRRPNRFTMLSWNLPKMTLRDELFDLISPVPELLQHLDEFHGNAIALETFESVPQVLQEGNELIMQCLAKCNELHAWELLALALCKENRSRQRSWSPGTPETNEDASSLLAVCKCHGIGFFFICAQYWAICIVLFSSTRRLHQQLSAYLTSTSTMHEIQDLPDWIDPEPCALNIAQTSHHYFTAEAGLWAAQSATFPLGTALGYYARTGRVDSMPFRMMVASFSETKSGTIVRDFLQNLARPA